MARPGKSLPDAAALRRQIDDRRMLAVRVVPNAAADQIVLAVDESGAVVTVRTTATPEGGKANEAMLRLLASALDVPASALELVRGATSRNKLVRVCSNDLLEVA